MVNVVAHSAQSGAHGGAALTDKTSEKKLSADAKESSCVFISARKPSFLKLPGFPIVPPPFNVKGRRPIPRLIGVGVCISELLLGAQAIRKFVKLYVGLHRRHAANQNDQNPFHQIHHASPEGASCTCQKLSDERRVPS